MKTIRATFLPHSAISQSLETRRQNDFDAASAKRHSRRFERRQAEADLRANLASFVAEGIESFRQKLRAGKAVTLAERPVVAASAVVATPEVVAKAIAFNADTATVIRFPVQVREIPVVRKRQFHRATLEVLRLAA